jgi:hypothetical protein
VAPYNLQRQNLKRSNCLSWNSSWEMLSSSGGIRTSLWIDCRIAPKTCIPNCRKWTMAWRCTPLIPTG